MKYPVIMSSRYFLPLLLTTLITACGGDNGEDNSGVNTDNKPAEQNNTHNEQSPGNDQNAGNDQNPDNDQNPGSDQNAGSDQNTDDDQNPGNNQNTDDDQNTDTGNPQTFEAKGGSYGSLFNAWKFPYLLFNDNVNKQVANGITYTLIRSANGDWDITMDGRDTVLNTRYDDYLQGSWRYSTQNGIAAIYETYDIDNDTTRLTYFDNGRIYRQLFDGDDLLTEHWYLDNGSEIRIAYDAWDLDSELTITTPDGSSALIYYNCTSTAISILTMTIQQLNNDCRSNAQEYN